MGLNVGRWWKYAQAKASDVVSSSHRDLDALEAERELEVADKPWLRSDGAAPTLDEARARIEAATEAAAAGPGPRVPADTKPSVPDGRADQAEVAAARLELDRRARQSAERLDAIRQELGVDRSDDELP